MAKNIDEICDGIERFADQLVETHDDYTLKQLSADLIDWLHGLSTELKAVRDALDA